MSYFNALEGMEEKLARAWSIENMYQHKDRAENLTYIGSVIVETRVYRIYEDSDGDTWYKTGHVDTITGEIMTDEEKIFGRKLRKKRYA